MSLEEMVKQATLHGNSLGQIALAEFLLKTYGQEIPPKLIQFLERLLQVEYENVGRNVHKPAEDVALEVSRVLENH